MLEARNPPHSPIQDDTLVQVHFLSGIIIDVGIRIRTYKAILIKICVLYFCCGGFRMSRINQN